MAEDDIPANQPITSIEVEDSPTLKRKASEEAEDSAKVSILSLRQLIGHATLTPLFNLTSHNSRARPNTCC